MTRSPEDPTHLSLEQAERESHQRIRRFNHAVIHELDSEFSLAVEVNGIPVRRISCMDSALEELAAGWAFLHHFIESPADFDRCSVQDSHAAVMVRGGNDINHRLAILNGAASERPHAPTPWPREESWSIPDDILLDVLREAWHLFRNDRMGEGSVHAALASAQGIEVVAFDNVSENAVAKVLGWCLVTGLQPAHEILVVNGPLTQVAVDAAVRLGVQILATPFVPTAEAYMTARVSGVNIIGYMRRETVGLFGGPDLIRFNNDLEQS